jgi:hypothetical protein
MADLEAEAEVHAQGSDARTIVMSRKKLRKLVQMLAYSVDILQSTIELDNQSRQEEFSMETLCPVVRIHSSSAGMVVEIDKTANRPRKKTHSSSAEKIVEIDKAANNPELEDEQSTERITVIPQEELVRKKAQKLLAFEGRLSPISKE